MTGLCGDAFLTNTLNAGNYFLAVTEYFNVPNGNLSDGFFQDGQGNFTGPDFCLVSGGFYDPGCNQRTGNFEVDIVGADTASSIPEPASMVTVGLALICLASLASCNRSGSNETLAKHM
jgi:hypothetical protein